MIKENERFLINYKECDEEFLKSLSLDLLEEKYQKIKSFFEFDGDLPKIKINFIYSVEEFESLYPDKHANWVSAFTGNNTTIYIFSPSVIEKLTIHKTSSIIPTIIHEMSHLFYGYSNLYNLRLFNEGIACYFQKGNSETRINFKIEDLTIQDPKFVYNVGHLIICALVDKFGEKDAGKKIIEFLKLYESKDSNGGNLAKFEDTMGVEINKLLQEHEIRNTNNYKEVKNNGRN